MNKRTRKKWLKEQGLYVNPKETWNLDYTIAKFVLPRLKLFKKLNNGYPGREGMETEEEWDEALDKMIWSFEQIINDNSYNIWSECDDDYYSGEILEINFCPICGRKINLNYKANR